MYTTCTSSSSDDLQLLLNRKLHTCTLYKPHCLSLTHTCFLVVVLVHTSYVIQLNTGIIKQFLCTFCHFFPLLFSFSLSLTHSLILSLSLSLSLPPPPFSLNFTSPSALSLSSISHNSPAVVPSSILSSCAHFLPYAMSA